MEIKQLISDASKKFDALCQKHLPAKDVLKEKTSQVAKIALAFVATAFIAFCVVSAAPLLFKAAVFVAAAIATVALYKHFTGNENPIADVKKFVMETKTKIEQYV
jgi:hypothetical protein